MSSGSTEVDVGGTKVTPPQDESQQATWIDQFTENGTALWDAWTVTELNYNVMVAQRARWGYPQFDEQWTKEQDDQFWSMHYAVAKITSYVSEVERRARAVAYDPSAKTLVALATVGEPSFSTENGALIIKMGGSEQVRISSAGFVGYAVPWGAVAGIAIAAATVATVYLIVQAYNKHIESVQASDLQKHTVEVCAKYGAEACPKILAAETDQFVRTELAKAEASRGSDAWALADAVKWGAVGVSVLAVVGAAWYFWPRGGRAHNPKAVKRYFYRGTWPESYPKLRWVRGAVRDTYAEAEADVKKAVGFDMHPNGTVMSGRFLDSSEAGAALYHDSRHKGVSEERIFHFGVRS